MSSWRMMLANAAAPLGVGWRRSTFEEDAADQVRAVQVVRTEYIPILPRDTVMAAVRFEEIGLLSIDAQGRDVEVLKEPRARLAAR